MTVPSKGRQRKRCGIYCIYAKYGHVARYVDYFLSKLVKSLDQLVIVANGELDADSRKRLERFADRTEHPGIHCRLRPVLCRASRVRLHLLRSGREKEPSFISGSDTNN